jgi:hypothetical protein
MCSLGEMQPTKSHHHHHHHLVTSCEAWLPTSHSATSTSVARESTNFSCSRRARVNAVDGGYAWAVAFVRRPRLRTPDRLTGTGAAIAGRKVNMIKQEFPADKFAEGGTPVFPKTTIRITHRGEEFTWRTRRELGAHHSTHRRRRRDCRLLEHW